MVTRSKLSEAHLQAIKDLVSNGFQVLPVDSKFCDLVALDINGIRLIKLKEVENNAGGHACKAIDLKGMNSFNLPEYGSIRKELWVWQTNKQKWLKENIV